MKIVKFYLEEKGNRDESLKELNDRYISEFCKKFDGATIYSANGLWSNGVRLFDEQANICELFVNIEKTFHGNKKAMVSYFMSMAKRYKREAKQEAVSIVIDGQTYIIK